MKLSRLHGRKVNDYVLRKGNVWKGKNIVIRWLRGAPKHPNVDPAAMALYVGTAASAKMEKSAVKRNRMRRRCREALRITVREVEKLPTLQLLIAPRSSSLDCAFADILQDVQKFLSTV
ncbi:MAG: ribonuclease P protein component [Candidatus Peribacteraceae bacterium]|nr:ribonuclease P protein component [Candidatus Peribacteraceae bacterium]